MFQLISDYSPAGDQPQAIRGLVEGYQSGARELCLVGVTGSGKTFTMASFIAGVNRPALVLTHNKTLAAQLYREFREFFPHNAVEYFVSYYDYYQPEAYVPTSDIYIEKDASINDEIDRLRLRATSSLLERQDVVIVSSVSCIYGLGSPEDYRHNLILLDKGLTVNREDVMRQLIRIQYSRNDIAFERGSFRVRGDVLEIFPAYRKEALRIQWYDDEIEELALIDPLSGNILDRQERVVIYPAKHFITSPLRLNEAVDKIEAELQERIAYFNQQKKPLEAERIASRTRYDLEMLREMGYCNGIENYSRHLSGRAEGEAPACLLNYFPDDFIVIIDESHVTLPQVRGMYAGDRSRKETLVEFGFRLPSALDNRPLNFLEFEERSPCRLYVSATPGDYELEHARLKVEQLIRPTGLLDPAVEVRPETGQIEDLVVEINRRIAAGERTLVTTLTKKMSEDLADYLDELGIKVAYLHSEVETIERVEIIRDLRLGVNDVLVGVNLLREGLDLPEVSLVAILDANKEGFLRNERSLIQTIGRAARNVNGKAILYADTITASMQRAIDETNRRRRIQEEYNIQHSISPRTIRKEVHNILVREIGAGETEDEMLNAIEEEMRQTKTGTTGQLKEQLKEMMLRAAAELQFEKAALLRDKLQSLETGRDIRGVRRPRRAGSERKMRRGKRKN